MTNPQIPARIAGAAYLVIIIAALFSEMVVRDGIIVTNDAAATAANILAQEELWRWSFFAELITAACDVVVAMLLYELLKPIGKSVSLLAAAFRMVLVAIAAVKTLLLIAPLHLLKDAYLSNFTAGQLQDLSYFSVRMLGVAYDVSLFFFGLHALLIGWLISRARFLPRVIGWFLMIAGLCYLSNTIGRILAPDLVRSWFPWIFLPAFVAEASLTLWLLIRGVNAEKWRAQAAA